MLAYAPFEPEGVEEPPPQAPALVAPTRQGVQPRFRNRRAVMTPEETECTYLVMFFIFGMIVLSIK
jgi:hypothetical protein